VSFDESLFSDNDGGMMRMELVNSLRLSKRLTTSLFSTNTAEVGGLGGGSGFLIVGLTVVVEDAKISNIFFRGFGNWYASTLIPVNGLMIRNRKRSKERDIGRVTIPGLA
jgi:hypothetical protein